MNSEAWKSWYSKTEEKIDEDIPRLEKIFRKNDVSRILDLGCGTGRHTVYFARRDFKVYGFDVSLTAVKRAKERLRKENLYADLRVWDMSNTFPYEDGFFDAVISIRVFHHSRMQTIRKVVREIERVTKTNGFVYVQVPTYEKVLRLKQEGGKFNEIEPGTFVPLEGPEKGIPHHNFKKEELLELFENFRIDEIRVRDEHYCLLGRKL
jgi:SAM-dependent methyltransferase